MFSKEINRWLRALGIAKILFEDQGYHRLYLDDIESLIRRKFMYSPRISGDLIPRLYQAAKAKRIPMTTLVNRILEKALNGGDRFGARKIGPNGKGPPIAEKDDGDGGSAGK